MRLRSGLTTLTAAAAALLVSGCANTLNQQPRGTSFKCVDTSSDAQGFGRAQARAAARGALAQEIPDAKGFLVSSGVSRVRVVSRRLDCGASPLPGFTKCTAHARLCGR